MQQTDWEVTVGRKINASAVVSSEQLQRLRTVPQRAVGGAEVTQHSLPLLLKTTRSMWRVQSRSPLRGYEGNRHWSYFPLPVHCNSSSAGRAVPHCLASAQAGLRRFLQISCHREPQHEPEFSANIQKSHPYSETELTPAREYPKHPFF